MKLTTFLFTNLIILTIFGFIAHYTLGNLFLPQYYVLGCALGLMLSITGIAIFDKNFFK
jgi:hypothetical protein